MPLPSILLLRPAASIACIAGLLAAAACSGGDVTATRSAGGAAYAVQLHNDGGVELRNVQVTTGQDVPPLTTSSLVPGEQTGVASVAMLHEHPIVSAVVNGRPATFHPVEGFGGFNAQLAPGRYVIRLRYVAPYDGIDARVVPVTGSASG